MQVMEAKEKVRLMIDAARAISTGIIVIETDAAGVDDAKTWSGPKLFAFDDPRKNVVFRGAKIVDAGRHGFALRIDGK
jgi:hypothetical protein